MTAPTEAEIRALVDEKMPTLAAMGGVADALNAVATVADDLWDFDDFRPSEERALDYIVDQHVGPVRRRILERADREMRKAIIAAALEFAELFPLAPRKADHATHG